jgi:hypothetical protein
MSQMPQTEKAGMNIEYWIRTKKHREKGHDMER